MPLAPTNLISQLGKCLRISSAIARAGCMWPPVPPPEIITLSIEAIYLFLTSSGARLTANIIPIERQVKRIEVLPGKRLSYQYHEKRSEAWTIVQGSALITIDGKDFELLKGQSIKIPQGSKHRIENIGKTDLIFIEIQTGSYFGEDDIVRIEDDYKRV